MREHRGQPVNNDKGQPLTDPLKHGQGAALRAAAAGPFAPSRARPIASRSKRPGRSAPAGGGFGGGVIGAETGIDPLRFDPRGFGPLGFGPLGFGPLGPGAPMNARLRRHARLRTRQALAPLRTAMWAAYPPLRAAAA